MTTLWFTYNNTCDHRLKSRVPNCLALNGKQRRYHSNLRGSGHKAPADVSLIYVTLFLRFARQLQHVIAMTDVATGVVDTLVRVEALQRHELNVRWRHDCVFSEYIVGIELNVVLKFSFLELWRKVNAARRCVLVIMLNTMNMLEAHHVHLPGGTCLGECRKWRLFCRCACFVGFWCPPETAWSCSDASRIPGGRLTRMTLSRRRLSVRACAECTCVPAWIKQWHSHGQHNRSQGVKISLKLFFFSSQTTLVSMHLWLGLSKVFLFCSKVRCISLTCVACQRFVRQSSCFRRSWSWLCDWGSSETR